jgi:hypothetical protein
MPRGKLDRRNEERSFEVGCIRIQRERERGRGNAVKRYIFLKIRELADASVINHSPTIKLSVKSMHSRGRKREWLEEREERLAGEPDVPAALLLKSDGRR